MNFVPITDSARTVYRTWLLLCRSDGRYLPPSLRQAS